MTGRATAADGGHNGSALAPVGVGVAVAAMVVVTTQLGNGAIALAIGAAAFAGGLWITGNPRLVCLLSLVATAPISLAKRFDAIPHMGGASAYSLELPDFFLVALLAFLVRDFVSGHRRHVRLPAAALWWLALTTLGVVSLVEGPYRSLAALQIVENLKQLLFLVVLVNELVRARQMIQVVTVLAAEIVLQSLVGFAEFVRRGSLGLERLGEATDATFRYAAQATYVDGASSTFRIGALIGHPNLLAGFLALLLPIMVAMLLTVIDGWRRIVIAAALVTGLAALVLTLSRTSWLAFGLAFVVLLALTMAHPRLRGRFVALRLGLVAALSSGLVVASPQIIRRLTDSDSGALTFRYEWMQVAWSMIEKQPIFGIGLNSFVFNLPGNTRFGGVAGLNQRFGDIWPVVHNNFLIIWSEQGTVGFICFIGVYASLFWAGWRNARRLLDERLYLLNLGAMAGLLATVIDGLGSFFLRNAQCARCFWLVAALILAIRYWQEANARLGRPIDVRVDGYRP